jgi:hypothetical protein
MKLKNVIAIFLVIMLTTSQALAAACSVACGMPDQQQQSQQSMHHHAAEEHCHHDDSDDSQDSNESSKNSTCSMAGCHLLHAVTFTSESNKPFIEASGSIYPKFISTAVTADQLPPIKPPA